jgi:hypothetical protein
MRSEVITGCERLPGERSEPRCPGGRSLRLPHPEPQRPFEDLKRQSGTSSPMPRPAAFLRAPRLTSQAVISNGVAGM